MKRLLIVLSLVGGLYAQPQSVNWSAQAPQGVSSVATQRTGAAGGVTLYYWVVANFTRGQSAAVSSIITNAPNNLDGSNYVSVFWGSAAGATSYDVLKTTTNVLPNTCTCAVVIGSVLNTVNDTGGVLSGYTYNPVPGATAAIRLDNQAYAVPTLVSNTPLVGTGIAGATIAATTNAIKGDGVGNGLAVTGNPTDCVLVNGSSATCGGGGGSSVWSALTAPVGNLALSMGANSTTFTYNAATGSIDGFKFVDTASNTGTGVLGLFTTAASSAMTPWQADANGVGWKVNTTGGLASVGATASGKVLYNGITSGNTVTTTVDDSTGTYTFKYPTSGGTNNYYLMTDGTGVTSWNLVSLTNSITGILAGANGGTGNGFFAVSGPATSLKTWTIPNSSINWTTLTGVIKMASGVPSVVTGSASDCVKVDGSSSACASGSSVGGGVSVFAAATTLSATAFLSPGGAQSSATEASVFVKASGVMSASNMQVNISTAPGAGESIVFTFRVAGADSTLTCTITDPATTCSDLTHVVAIAQGDNLSIKAVPSTSLASKALTIMTQLGTGVQDPGSNGVMLRTALNTTSAVTIPSDATKVFDGTGAFSFAPHAVGAMFYQGGSVLAPGTALGSSLWYTSPLPWACTLGSWTVTVNTGTIGFRVWRKAAGTAIPTVADTLNGGDLAITTGTNLKSTTMTNFTGGTAPVLAVGDILAFQLNAASSATVANVSLQCQ